ncbi:MAG: hypothetical protein R8K20_01005, partial [Gallionellaceae bacterium]
RNQGIVGAENLANQNFNQDLSRLNAFSGLSQADIVNQLNAQQRTVGNLFGSQQNEINFANAVNAARLGTVGQQNAAAQQAFGNVVGGIGAGTNFAKDIGSAFNTPSASSVPAATSAFNPNAFAQNAGVSIPTPQFSAGLQNAFR